MVDIIPAERIGRCKTAHGDNIPRGESLQMGLWSNSERLDDARGAASKS